MACSTNAPKRPLRWPRWAYEKLAERMLANDFKVFQGSALADLGGCSFWRILGVARLRGSSQTVPFADLRCPSLRFVTTTYLPSLPSPSYIFPPSHLRNKATTSIPKDPHKRKSPTLCRAEHLRRCSATSSPFPWHAVEPPK